jgi:hypothetical protein
MMKRLPELEQSEEQMKQLDEDAENKIQAIENIEELCKACWNDAMTKFVLEQYKQKIVAFVQNDNKDSDNDGEKVLIKMMQDEMMEKILQNHIENWEFLGTDLFKLEICSVSRSIGYRTLSPYLKAI